MYMLDACSVQVFVSGSNGTAELVEDGYTSINEDLSATIDLTEYLMKGFNRISITTIYNDCAADKVSLTDGSAWRSANSYSTVLVL